MEDHINYQLLLLCDALQNYPHLLTSESNIYPYHPLRSPHVVVPLVVNMII